MHSDSDKIIRRLYFKLHPISANYIRDRFMFQTYKDAHQFTLSGLLIWSICCCLISFSYAEDEVKDKKDSIKSEQKKEVKDEKDTAEPTKSLAQKLNEQAKKSIAVITFLNREGEVEGLGTGFVVDKSGLIATNFHVIGEHRPILVKLGEQELKVISIEASDEKLDLALLRVDAKNLPALTIGDSSKVVSGESVVAIGNPRGLTHSVVSGVVSAKREIDQMPMIQVAIPIEPGNSGGPLLNRKGEVIGIITMKSLYTPNLGFAVEINPLKEMIEKPNPIVADSVARLVVAYGAGHSHRDGDGSCRHSSGRHDLAGQALIETAK